MDDFQVEKDIPGVITSFSLPSMRLSNLFADGDVLDINYRRMYKRLTGRKKTISSYRLSQISTEESELPDIGDSAAFKPAKRYESIIDKLERKYYTLPNAHLIDDDNSNSNFSDGDDSRGSNIGDSPAQSTLNSKKRKKFAIDEYDYSDPFLDDSEAVVELEDAIKRKLLKTKNDGFFISSGKLEVVPSSNLKLSRKNDYAKFKAASSSSTANSTLKEDEEDDDVNDSSEVRKSNDTAVKKKSKKRKAAEESSSNPDTSAIEVTFETTKPAKNNKTSSSKEEDKSGTHEKKKKEKTITEKAVWNPHSDVVIAIQIFTTAVEAVIGVAAGSAVVTECVDTALSSTALGVNDSTTNYMGIEEDTELIAQEPAAQVTTSATDNSPAPAATTTISAANKKRTQWPKELEIPLLTLDSIVHTHHSAKELSKVTGYYELYQNLLGPHFTQGRMKTLMTKLSSREKAKEYKAKIEPFIGSLMSDLAKQITDCPAYRQPGNRANKKASKGNENDQLPLSAPDEAETNEVPQSSARVESTTNPASEQPVNSEQAIEPGTITAADTSSTAIVYKWYCKWTINLRTRILELEDLVEEFVTAENAYREKLTANEKREINDEEVRII
jgi:hypothetical protein